MAPKKLTGNEPRVASAELQRWATACFCAAGCTDEDANLLSELLVDTDLRGVSTYCSTQSFSLSLANGLTAEPF